MNAPVVTENGVVSRRGPFREPPLLSKRELYEAVARTDFSSPTGRGALLNRIAASNPALWHDALEDQR